MPETANVYNKIRSKIPGVMFFIIIIIFIFLFIESYISNNHSQPPNCIPFENMSVSNNTGLNIASYSISAFAGLLSIVALCMYVLGFMLSLVVIGTGNYREQFINSVKNYENCYGAIDPKILGIMK